MFGWYSNGNSKNERLQITQKHIGAHRYFHLYRFQRESTHTPNGLTEYKHQGISSISFHFFKNSSSSPSNFAQIRREIANFHCLWTKRILNGHIFIYQWSSCFNGDITDSQSQDVLQNSKQEDHLATVSKTPDRVPSITCTESKLKFKKTNP